MFLQLIDSDGKNKEGIGSLCQFQLLGVGISEFLNYKFFFNGFKNVAVGKNTQNLDKELNNFFNFQFTKNESMNSFKVFKGYFGDKQTFSDKLKKKAFFLLARLLISKIFKRKSIINLSNNLIYEGEVLYKDDMTNVAIHLRAPQYNQDVIFEKNRRVYYDLFKQIDYYNTLIRCYEHINNSKNIKFYVFTDYEFKNLELIHPLKESNKIEYVITNNIEKTIFHLINADILFAANSGLSLISHYLSTGITYFHNSIKLRNEPVYPNVVFVDDDGYFKI